MATRAAARRCRWCRCRRAIAFVRSGERSRISSCSTPRSHRVAHARDGRRAVAVEKAEQAIDEYEAAELEEKLRKNEFTLETTPQPLKTIRAWDARERAWDDPGARHLKQLAEHKPDENRWGRIERIIFSMTPEERVISR